MSEQERDQQYPDVEAHSQRPMTDEPRPDEELEKRKAGEEGDDVEAHMNRQKQEP